MEKSAEQGDAVAQNSLGNLYYEGKGVEQDYKQAFECFAKSAKQGNADAQYNLGLAYYKGYGVGQDYKQAVEFWEKSANKGNAFAQNGLGVAYRLGDGVDKDIDKAIEWHRKSAEQGNSDAQFNLGSIYYEGKGVDQDYKQAVEWYIKSAEQGDVDAQFNLGQAYYYGRGVEKDYKQAVYWWKKSANNGKGNAKAQYNLGVVYYNFWGVKQDYKQAVYWYTKSAQQGNANAQCNLGLAYYEGKGVDKKDDEKSVEWWEKSANQGNAVAQCNLGGMYYNCEGVDEKNVPKAYQLFTKSAQQGNANAQFYLGMIYEQNFDGVDQDYDEAVKWYRQSLNGGLEEPEKLDIDDLPLAKIVFEIHSVLENLRIKNANNISLTHFTSFEVFKKVIEKGTVNKLRLNDIDSCNDPKEGKTLFEYLEYDEFKKYVDKSNNEKDSYPLVLSFCDGNPENLPMWNQYADHSKGVGLSLNKDSIEKLVSSFTMYRDNLKGAVSNPIEDSNKDLESSAKDSSVKSNKNSDNPQKNIFPTLYRVMYLPRNKEITEIDEGDLKIEYQEAFKNLQQAFKNSQQKFKKPEEELKYLKEKFENSQESFKNLQQALKHLQEVFKQIDKIMNGDYDEQLPKLLAELAHIIKYDDYAYEKEIRLVQFAFKDDIDSNTGVKSTYCEDNHGIYSNAPDFIKFELITIAPKVGKKDYLYAKHLGDSNGIRVEKSEIKFQ